MIGLRVVVLLIYTLSVFDVAIAADDTGTKAKDGTPPAAPTNAAPPISTIATGSGQYFCIYHDRIYSAGAEICAWKSSGLRCKAGHTSNEAAQWVEMLSDDGKEVKISSDGCMDAQTPAPQ